MPACPACRTMISRPDAPHRDLIGVTCPGLPTDPVCGVCGRPVGLDEHGSAGMHTSNGQECHGSTGCDCACRRPPTAEDLAAREAARVARRARLARGQWTDAGAGLQARLA